MTWELAEEQDRVRLALQTEVQRDVIVSANMQLKPPPKEAQKHNWDIRDRLLPDVSKTIVYRYSMLLHALTICIVSIYRLCKRIEVYTKHFRLPGLTCQNSAPLSSIY